MIATTEKKAAKAGRTRSTRAIAPTPGPMPAIVRASALLKNVSDPTRLQVVTMLDEHGAMNVGELCGELGCSQPAVSHHLALMRYASMIEPRRQGKHVYYALTEKGRTLAGVVKTVMGTEG